MTNIFFLKENYYIMNVKKMANNKTSNKER